MLLSRGDGSSRGRIGGGKNMCSQYVYYDCFHERCVGELTQGDLNVSDLPALRDSTQEM